MNKISPITIERKKALGLPLTKRELDFYARNSYFSATPSMDDDLAKKKENLILLMLPNIRKQASRYHQKFPSVSYNDFLQEALTEVWGKIDNYKRKIKINGEYVEIMFSTYIVPIIKDAMQKCIANNTKNYIGTTNLKILAKAKKLLEIGLSYNQIAQKLNCSKERIVAILSSSTTASLDYEIDKDDNGRSIELIDTISFTPNDLEYNIYYTELTNLLVNSVKLNNKQLGALYSKVGFINEDNIISRQTRAWNYNKAIALIQESSVLDDIYSLIGKLIQIRNEVSY